MLFAVFRLVLSLSLTAQNINSERACLKHEIEK